LILSSLAVNYVYFFLANTAGKIFSKPTGAPEQIYVPQYPTKISDLCRQSVNKENLVFIRKGVAECQYNSSHGFQAARKSFLDPGNGQRRNARFSGKLGLAH
jgi:hypothetical protein